MLALMASLPMLLGLNCGDHDDDDPLGTNSAGLSLSVSGSGEGTVTAKSSTSNYEGFFQAFSCRKASGTCVQQADMSVLGPAAATLTATPDPSSRFVSWQGDCQPIQATPNQATISLKAQETVTCTAIFERTTDCNNPVLITSTFDTDADWIRNEFGSGVSGSNPTTGGNPGGYRQGELSRNPTAYASYTVFARHVRSYDSATEGRVTAIEYSEDRYVNGANSGEGIFSGLYVDDAHGTTSLVAQDPPGLFATNTWTNVSMRVEAKRFPSLSTFHVGYMREIQVNPGSGVLQHGIDNVTIRICR
jgi:hypothetical protein